MHVPERLLEVYRKEQQARIIANSYFQRWTEVAPPLVVIDEIYTEAGEKDVNPDSVLKHLMARLGIPKVKANEVGRAVGIFRKVEKHRAEGGENAEGAQYDIWQFDSAEALEKDGLDENNIVNIFNKLASKQREHESLENTSE